MRIFIGSYTRMGGPGVAVCAWEDGKLALLSTCHDVNDPTYVILSSDSRFLYAVGSYAENGQGAIASYRVNENTLELLSVQATGGLAACHLALSPDERFLYVANYLSGSVAVFPVTDGVLGEHIQLIERTGHGPHPSRQESSHTHQCVFCPGTTDLFVNDLGTDHVVVYEQNLETGLLAQKEEIVMPGGMGPRHLVFASAEQFYVTGELDNRVRRVVLKDGTWTITGEICVLPDDWKGQSATAAIRLHDGALWVSNRGHDSLCKIELNENGEMTSVSWNFTGGQIPRDFMFVPGGILYAHQAGSGVIASTGASIPMDGAVCICPDWKTI